MESGKLSRSDCGRLGAEKAKHTNLMKSLEFQKRYRGNPNYCKKCGLPLVFENRKNLFCSHSCAASFNNMGIRRHGVDPRDKKLLRLKEHIARRTNSWLFENKASPELLNVLEKSTCLFCGNIKKNKRSLYCSQKCNQAVLSKKLIQDWLDNRISGMNISGNPSKFIKRYLKESRGVRCEICGLTEWCGKEVPLVLDHIDGHSENSRPENLRLVCGNCDMQLSTYKGKNKGKGRLYRRQRYAEGKSY